MKKRGKEINALPKKYKTELTRQVAIALHSQSFATDRDEPLESLITILYCYEHAVYFNFRGLDGKQTLYYITWRRLHSENALTNSIN